MKILLTGASGMVGRNILADSGAKYFEFLCPSSKELNLTNYENTVDYCSKHSPDMIIHVAGRVGGINANIKEPILFLADNVQMGLNILLSAQRTGIKKLINLATSCMYPRKASNPLVEDLLLTGELEPTNEGYALAKIVTQRLCSYINQQKNGFSYKTLIPCNLFGKFDNFNLDSSHLIPAIIKKIDLAKRKKKDVEIWGDGTARREFLYVENLTNAIFFILNQYNQTPSLMNIGLGHDHSINDYYNMIAKIMGFDGTFYHNLEQPTGMQQKLLSINLQNSIGWKPKYSLKQGLAKTIDYYHKEIK